MLWAAFQACGGAPAIGIIALAYMLGQLGNLLPLPGGVGGVEPLMLGIFVSSGVVSVVTLVPAVRRERNARAPRVPQAAASGPS